jgi:DNA polymerase
MSAGAVEAYPKLVEQILACQKCGLCRTRTQAVPGSGSITAELMFVGEGPGKNEDEQGIPFCGASGKLLAELLASIGLNRDQVFITNIVKCRPPDNRDPLPDEITSCAPYLQAQTDIIKPRVIATLGRYALNHFLPNQKISEAHGRALRHQGQIFVPLYHPAVALYRASMKDELMADFQVIKKVLNKLAAEPDLAASQTALI